MTRLIRRPRRIVGMLAVVSTLAAWGMATALAQDAKAQGAKTQDTKAPDYAAIVASPDRSDADRQTDQRRAPAKMLAFAGAKPGMKVLDLEAGAG